MKKQTRYIFQPEQQTCSDASKKSTVFGVDAYLKDRYIEVEFCPCASITFRIKSIIYVGTPITDTYCAEVVVTNDVYSKGLFGDEPETDKNIVAALFAEELSGQYAENLAYDMYWKYYVKSQCGQEQLEKYFPKYYALLKKNFAA